MSKPINDQIKIWPHPYWGPNCFSSLWRTLAKRSCIL